MRPHAKSAKEVVVVSLELCALITPSPLFCCGSAVMAEETGHGVLQMLVASGMGKF